ncbi:hypothetical protein BY996DRAFT_1525837 [Phakopsora pachyrhizi]|nr:hypothetical protein BY996DRAFT_1525837 [Phakopsora pachyrhizi]
MMRASKSIVFISACFYLFSGETLAAPALKGVETEANSIPDAAKFGESLSIKTDSLSELPLKSSPTIPSTPSGLDGNPQSSLLDKSAMKEIDASESAEKIKSHPFTSGISAKRPTKSLDASATGSDGLVQQVHVGDSQIAVDAKTEIPPAAAYEHNKVTRKCNHDHDHDHHHHHHHHHGPGDDHDHDHHHHHHHHHGHDHDHDHA